MIDAFRSANSLCGKLVTVLGTIPLTRNVVVAFLAGTAMTTTVFAQVMARPEGFTQISSGNDHTCGVTKAGGVQCWGNNAAFFTSSGGRLGDGTTTSRNTPTDVTGITNAVSASAGFYHSCAALASGIARCWGDNSAGALGTGTTTSSTTPVAVTGISNAVAVTAGGAHSCALTSAATVKCWGASNFGQVGNSSTGGTITTPADVTLTNVVDVSAGGSHTCAVRSSGDVWCWGRNSVNTGLFTVVAAGQLGNGTTSDSSSPVQVLGISNATQVSAGIGHTCARLADGTVRCWGYNSVGQLGNSSTTGSSTPVLVSGISNAVNVSAGGKDFQTPNAHSCVALNDGSVKCWGRNGDGQLGNQSNLDSTTPVSVVNVLSANSVTAGKNFTCGKTVSGDVLCVGANASGELGNATNTQATAAKYVSTKCNLDLDGDGQLLATTDGVLLSRALSGYSGNTLTVNALSATAKRTSPAEITAYIAQVCPVTIASTTTQCGFDLDGNSGAVAVGTDSLLFARAVLGFNDTAVTASATGSGAARGNWSSIRNFLTQTCGVTGLAP